MSMLSYDALFIALSVFVSILALLILTIKNCKRVGKRRSALMVAIVTSLAIHFIPVHAQTAWVGWPSVDENDGRFIAITGPLSAIDYVAPNIIIGVPNDATTFDIQLFDGDASADLTSKYDINVSTSGFTYTLYQDPNRDGTGSDIELTRTQADFANDTWSSYITNHPVSETAHGQGGFYWYRLSLEFNGNPDTEQFFNALKIRVRSNATSPASVGALKEIIIGSSPFNPVFDPGLGSPDNTYDGDWVFNVRVTGGATPPLNFSDSDADYSADANAPGTPPDDNFSRPEFLISPSIRYELFDPSGNLITLNTDPSGTEEEETFSYNPPVAAPAGLYQWHWFGVDASNVLILRTDFELLPVSYENAAALGNYVWLDENGDGLQDAGEPGLAGVNVLLKDNIGDVVGSQLTDSNGGYLFDSLVPGTYTVEIDALTLPAGVTQTENPVLAGADLGNQSLPYTVDLSSGEVNLTADFGFSYGDPNGNQGLGALGDKIWIDSNGNGLQDAGEIGLGGVELTIYTDTNGDGVIDPGVDSPVNAAVDSEGNTGTGTTTTNADGSYIFSELPNDAYVVVVNPATLPAGYVQTADPDEFGEPASAPDNQTTSAVVLEPGDVFLNVDFGYQPVTTITNTIGDTVFLDTNANGNEDAGEPGIGDVTVSLLNGDGDPIATTTTDAAGQYLFSGLPDGDYSVVVTDVNGMLVALSQSADPDSMIDGKSSLSVAAGESNLDQDFGYIADGHVPNEGLLGDTVFIDRNLNGLEDEGEGLGSIKVQLYDVTGTALVGETYTNSDGLYLFGGLDPTATYTVKVDTTSLPGGLVNTIDPDGGNDSESSINLAVDPDGSNDGINLGQDFGYVLDASYQIPGTIGDTVWLDANADGVNDTELGADGIAGTDDDEPGIEGVTLDLYFDVNGDGELQAGEPRVRSTVTDNTGTYMFDQLPTGDYIVDVSDDAGLLNGYWHSLGAADTNDQSQSDPYAVNLPNGGAVVTADFGYYYELASVGDLVWFDANANGIQDASEPGIAGATVELTITYPDGSQSILSTVTDSSGLYSFDNLLGDEDYNGDTNDGSDEPVLTIRVDAPSGLIASPINQGSDDSVDSDNGQGELGQPVMGGIDDTNDFGFYDLGSISGSVSEDIDRDGSVEGPLESVTVILYADNNRDGAVDDLNGDGVINAADELGRDTTDAAGSYEFTGLAPGDYLVSEIDPDGYESILDNDEIADVPADGTEIANSNPADNLLPVSLIVDFEQLMVEDDNGNNFIDAPILAGLGDTVWYDQNANGVQDANESGIENVTVNLLDSNGSVVDTMVTDSSGFYQFTDLLAGGYTIEIDPATLGSAQQQTYDLDDGVSTSPATPNAVTITLAAGDSNYDVDFGYRPLGSLGDTVWNDTNANGIQDAGETGIAGVEVTLTGTVSATATTNADGVYAFTDLPVGTYTVAVSGSALDGLQQTHDLDDPVSTTPTTANTTDVDLVLSATGDSIVSRDDVDFGYREKSLITGTVTEDTDGDRAGDQPQSGVIIELYKDSDADGQPDTLVASTVTDLNGSYVFTDLPAGDYVVVEITPGNLSNVSDEDSTQDGDPFDSDKIVDDQIAVTLGSGETDDGNDFVNENSGSISGTVSEDTLGDDLGDTPQQGVIVELYEVDGSSSPVGDPIATTTTAADGSYTFENVSPGDYAVAEVQPSGLSDVSDSDLTPEDGNDGDTPVDNLIPVTVQPGEADNDNNFVDQHLGSIGDFVWNDINMDGVQNPDEPGIAGVTIGLYNAAGQLVAMSTTPSDGSYQFTDVPAGDYTVTIIDGSLPLGFLPTYDLDGIATEHTATFTLTSGENRTDVDFGYALPLQCNACSGKIDSLTLRYQGNTNDAHVVVVQKNGDTVFDGLVQPGGQFSFVGTDASKQMTLGTEILVYINGEINVMIHTSCSQPIGPGAVFGEFLVVYGTSRNGGQLCTIDHLFPGSISGTVTEDQNGDDLGDTALVGITIELYIDSDLSGLPVGSPIATTTTAVDGGYLFNNLNPADYIVVEVDPADYISVSDLASIDNDIVFNSNTNDNIIPVSVKIGESDINNDFVDEANLKDPSIDIRKQAEGFDVRSFALGDTVEFEIVVTNTGNVDLTNVEVSDPLVPACDNTIGFLAAGTSTTYTCSTVLEAGADIETTVFFDNFESDQGWIANPDGNDTATTGQWQAADSEQVVYKGYDMQLPHGYNASSGNWKGLFTGPLAGSSVGSYDIDGGKTSMKSPSIVIPAGGLTELSLQYYFAHASNANSNDFLKIQVYDQYGANHTLLHKSGTSSYVGASWTELTVDLSSFAGQAINLVVKANDATDKGGVIEAAVDEINLVSTTTQAPSSGFTNIAYVSGEVGGQTVTDSDPSEVLVDGDLCVPEPGDSYTNGQSYSIWINGEYFSANSGNTFIPNASNGTARYKGSVTSNSSGTTYSVDMTYGGFTKTAPTGSPKLPGYSVDASNWVYYTTISGSVGPYTVSRRGPALQVGYGANMNDTGYGASGWMYFTNGSTTLNGDINISLTDCGEPPVVCEDCISGQSQITLKVSNWDSSRDQGETIRVREGGLGGALLFDGQVSNGGSFTFDMLNPGATIVVTVQGYNHSSEYVKGTFVTDCDLYINKTSGNSYITFKVTKLVSDGVKADCGDNSGNSGETHILNLSVSQGTDDAEEKSSGSMYLNSSDLELIYDGSNQTVGIRFQGVTIPSGATITNAYIEFQTDSIDSGATSVTFRGHNTDNASTFSSSYYNISSRGLTSSSVAWNNIAAWNTVGEKHQSSDLSAIVQEIVDRGGWSAGNSMAFIVTGSGARTAEAYEGDSSGAPKLHIEYTTSLGTGGTDDLVINDVATTTLTNAKAGLCLDTLGVDVNSSVYKATCTGGLNQEWELKSQGSYFEIVNADSNLCLDVYGSSTSRNSEVGQSTCTQNSNQLWEIQASGSDYLIKSKSSGMCLEVVGTGNAYQYTCDGYVGQRWSLTKPGVGV